MTLPTANSAQGLSSGALRAKEKDLTRLMSQAVASCRGNGAGWLMLSCCVPPLRNDRSEEERKRQCKRPREHAALS